MTNENKVWSNLDIRLENHKDVVDKLNDGLKRGFGVYGILVENILITKNQKSNNAVVFVLDVSGHINDESIIFTINTHGKRISPYGLYRALRLKIKDFARRERRDQEALDRIFNRRK